MTATMDQFDTNQAQPTAAPNPDAVGPAPTVPSIEPQVEQTAPTPDVPAGVIRVGATPRGPAEMEPLFHLNGVTYSIPKKVGANVALKVMSRFEQVGEVAAQIYMLRTVLGVEAFDALMGCDDLQPEEFSAISDKVQDLVLSSAQGAAGK